MNHNSSEQTTPAPPTPAGPVMIFGCGYVGTALLRRLRAAGVAVGALTRNPDKVAALRGLGAAPVIEAELDDRGWHGDLAGDFGAVVNCVSSAGGGLDGYRKSYVEGQKSVLAWARERRVGQFVLTGSTSVYPQGGGAVVDESAPTDGAPDTGRLVLASERLLREAGDAFGAWHILRLCGIYGPGRHYLLDQLRAGVTVFPGSGAHTLNTIHRDDIADALYLVLAKGGPDNSGIYNLADDRGAPKREVVRWLAAQIGAPPPDFDPDRVSPRLRRRGGPMPDRRIANDRFKTVFGWRPRYPDFREGYAAIFRAEAEGGGDARQPS